MGRNGAQDCYSFFPSKPYRTIFFNYLIFLTITLIKLILKKKISERKGEKERLKLNISIASSSIYSSGLGKVTSALNSTKMLSPWGFPGGAAVKNPPVNAEDTGLSPGPGRSHMPRSN